MANTDKMSEEKVLKLESERSEKKKKDQVSQNMHSHSNR